MAPATERWRIFFESGLDPRWLAAAAAAVAAVWLLALWRARGLRPGQRVALGLLRAGALGVAFAALAEPAFLRERVRVERGRVAVLVDRSESLELPEGAGERREAPGSRRDALARWFDGREGWWEDLASRFDVDLYRFGEALRPAADLADLFDGPPDRTTDLAAALEALGARYEPGALAAVLVLGDGADNGRLGRTFEETGAIGAAASAMGIPIHALGVGDPTSIRDYAVESVAHEDFGFVRTAMTIRAVIDVLGYEAARVPVSLHVDGEGAALANARLVPGRNEVEFRYVPEHAGEHVFEVSIPPYAGELATENNAASFVARVIRDRVRVLHVVGQPSWDERFLRRFLKQSPNVDLISFFILRTPEDLSSTPQNELSLIPFPTDELFTRELKGFDLIVLQNFNYRPYVRPEYLDNMARYVTDGGALVMIGGELSFGAGGYAGTALEDVLPVRLWGVEPEIRYGEFAAEISAPGLRHPVMRLDPRDDANRAQWAALPTLEGVNRVQDVRSGATVLAWGPPEGGGRRAPLVVVGGAGRGRVMTVATDTTWRWSFLNAERQGTGDAYHRFWDNAVRWLVKDPEFGRLAVSPRRARFDPGEAFEIDARLLDTDYRAAAGEAVDLRIERHPGREPLVEERARTDEDGAATVRWTPDAEGIYRIVAASGAERAEAVVVSAPDEAAARERRRTALGHEFLQALAEASGGAFATVARDRAFVGADIPASGRVQVLGRDREPLWDSAWMLALFLALAGGEWAARKRWGLA